MNAKMSVRMACFCTVSLLALGGNAFGQTRKINIPAEDMRVALDTYIQQSGAQLVYAVNDVEGLKSQPVSGDYAPGEALERMVQGTPLRVNRDVSGAIVVAQSAQNAPANPPPADQGEVESVVVTGSRVISDVANSPTPVTIMSTSELTATTPSNVVSALAKLPVFMGNSSTANRSQGTNNQSGTLLNLRNFGNNRNLVLFDGHRLAQTNRNGSINTDILPEMLMQRVDVVTGGASAIYGSDAVTGVVNFVLDKNFNGVKYQANLGTNQALYGTQYQAGVAAGTDLFGGRAHIEGSARFFHQDQVLNNVLPYMKDGQVWAYAGAGTAANPYYLVSNARRNDQPFGGLILCGGCSVQNETFVQNGIIGPYDSGTQTATSTLSIGGTGRRDLFTAYQGMRHTAQGFLRFSYDLDDNTALYFQGRASESGIWNNGPNNGIPSGSGSSARPNTFYITNPYLTAAAQAQLAAGNPGCPGGVPSNAPTCTFTFQQYFATLNGYSPNSYPGITAALSPSVPGNLPIFSYHVLDRNMAGTLGADGVLGNFTWDLYYTHEENRENNTQPVNQDFQKTYAAEDAVVVNGKIVCYVSTTPYAYLYPNCDPINPFGPNSLTSQQYASFTVMNRYIMTNAMDDIGGSISGELFQLPAGPVKAALSGEARWLTYDVASNAQPGFVDCTGLRLCSTASPRYFQSTVANANASEDVYEFAAEVNLPLLRDAPLAQDLSIDLAGRYTNYSPSGGVETWKIGLDHRVNDTIRFRGTLSVDIRAPTLDDLYAPHTTANGSLQDILTGKGADLLTVSQGNPNLKPEVAHTYTAGIVLTPTFIANLTASVDYYQINLYNAITALTYTNPAIQQICIASGGSSPYCSLATRPFPISNTSTANFPTQLNNQSLNSATQKTEGIDVELDYNFDLADVFDGAGGTIRLRGLGSLQPYVTNVTFPGATPTWTAMPKARLTGFLTYQAGNWTVNVQDSWLSGYSQHTAPNQFFTSGGRVDSYNQIDLTLSRRFAVDDSSADIYLSVQDVLDAKYPLSPSLSAAANPGFNYPVALNWGYSLGRYITVGIRGNL